MKQHYFSGKIKDGGGFLFPILLISVLITAGCAALRTPCPCDAPEAMILEGKEITVNAEVERHESDGTGRLTIRAMLVTADRSAFPTAITIGSFYIRPSDLSHDAFEGSFELQSSDREGGVWVGETNHGPDWRQGELTDVAVQLTDRKGRVFFLKKDNVVVK